MIGWGGIYKVVEAMVPLYVALALGYGSVRWWRIFTPEQCDAINRLVACFTLPLFAFDFTLHTNPFAMNYRAIAADAISKVIIILVIAAWAKCSGGSSSSSSSSSKGGYCWSITSFSLSTLTNSLVVGVPLASAMYGRWAQDLVVQLSVVQAIVWLTLLLFVFELRKAHSGLSVASATAINGGGALSPVKDVETNGTSVEPAVTRPPFWSLMKEVWLKLALNPNSYASFVGITWAFISNRHHGGVSADYVQGRDRNGHVQHGPLHGTAREDHRVRAELDGVRDGSQVRRRPCSNGDWIDRCRPSWRRSSCRNHTGCTASIYHLIYFREGIRITCRSAQHCGHFWDACFLATASCLLCASRIH